MGKHFTLALQLPIYRHNRQQQKAKAAKPGVDAGRYGIAIAVLCAVAVLVYLFQVNSFSTKGYEIRQLQNQLQTLKDEQRKLEFQEAQLSSLQRIQTDPNVINMVPVSTVSYLPHSGALSQR